MVRRPPNLHASHRPCGGSYDGDHNQRVADAICGQWYRVDLLFFHWCLHCRVIIDLKIGVLSHADAG